MPKVIKVIVSDIRAGSGRLKGAIKYKGGLSEHILLEDDLARHVTQYHTLDGKFLVEVDSRSEKIISDFNVKEKNNK